MPLRSILALMSTVDVLEEKGVHCAPILARHGLEPERLDPNGEIERDRELAVLTELLPLADDPLFGFEMGKRFGLAGYGPLTMLLMTSRTAFQGFQIGVRYQALTYLYGKLSLVPGEDTTKLILEPVPLPDSVRRILIDRDMTGTFNLVNEIQTQLGSRAPSPAVPHRESSDSCARRRRAGGGSCARACRRRRRPGRRRGNPR